MEERSRGADTAAVLDRAHRVADALVVAFVVVGDGLPSERDRSSAKPTLVSLVSPYSHPEAVVRQQRFQAVCQATAALLRSGQAVFAPIVHSHPLVAYGLPGD